MRSEIFSAWQTETGIWYSSLHNLTARTTEMINQTSDHEIHHGKQRRDDSHYPLDKRCVDVHSSISGKSLTTKSVPGIPTLDNCLVRELSALRRSTLLWTYSATIVCQCWLQCVSFWLIMIFGVCVFDVRWCKQRASLHIRWMRARKLPRIVSVGSNRAEIYFNLSCSLGRCAYWSISIATKWIITQNNSNQAEQTLLDISLLSRRFFLFFSAAAFQYACVHSIFALLL